MNEREASISIPMLRELFRLDESSGELFWKSRPPELFTANPKQLNKTVNSWNSKFAGKRAFTAIGGNGYAHGNIFHQDLYAHRVVWAISTGFWPVNHIDHIDGIRSNNRPINLRDISRVDNSRNTAIGSRNTSGVIGVCFYKRDKTWHAQITVNGKNIHIGYFKTLKSATEARNTASRSHGFHENHGRVAA